MIRKRRLILLTKKEYVRRYVYFVVGIFILSFGIALSTRADLGVSPVREEKFQSHKHSPDRSRCPVWIF